MKLKTLGPDFKQGVLLCLMGSRGPNGKGLKVFEHWYSQESKGGGFVNEMEDWGQILSRGCCCALWGAGDQMVRG